MSSVSHDPLEAVIRDAGEGWLIDAISPDGAAIESLRNTLREVDACARERLGKRAPEFSEESITAAYRENKHRVRAFLQALGGTRNPSMLLMAWRIIQGMEIEDVRLEYRSRESFLLRVTLRSPYGEPSESYESAAINDATLLRHLGILEIDGRPVFSGFYPLRLMP